MIQTEKYTKFPYTWLEALAGARCVESWRWASFLLWRKWKFPNDETVSVNNIALRKLRFTGQQKHNAITELEALGLVTTFGLDGIVSAVKLLQVSR
jgi:hypothetical protein